MDECSAFLDGLPHFLYTFGVKKKYNPHREKIHTGIRFQHVAEFSSGPEWISKVHAHPFHEIIYLVSGDISVRAAECSFAAVAGDVISYPAGCVHEERSTGTAPIAMIYFGWEGTAPHAAVVHDHNARIGPLMRWLLDEKFTAGIGMPDVRAPFAEAVFAEFSRLSAAREQTLAEKVRAYIYGHLEDTVSLDALASFAGMSKFSFLRRYRAEAGQTPMDDVRRIRLEKARDLAVTTGLPLAEIAERTGFSSEYHFNQAFKKKFGIPPGRFRDNGK